MLIKMWVRIALGFIVALVAWLAVLPVGLAAPPGEQEPESVEGAKELVEQVPEPSVVGQEVVGDKLVDFMDDRTFWLGIIVLSFGLIVLVTQAIVLVKLPRPSNDPMRHMIILTVITATLLTVVVGLSSESVAPAMGLFGTIVGYLLGTNRTGGNTSIPSIDTLDGTTKES